MVIGTRSLSSKEDEKIDRQAASLILHLPLSMHSFGVKNSFILKFSSLPGTSIDLRLGEYTVV